MSWVPTWWRWLEIGWVDLVLAIGLSVLAVLMGPGTDGVPPSWAMLLCTAPLLLRRRFAIPVWVLAIVGFSIAGNASNLAGLAGGLIATLSVGLNRRNQVIGGLVVLAGALAIAFQFGLGPGGQRTDLPIPSWLTPFLLIGSAFLAGRAISQQRARADEVERSSEAAVKAAAESERRHIARELHDVIAHSVSVMVVQAGAARHAMDEKPEAARESLKAVERSGHEAMAELRRMLGVLGDNESEAPLAPQPGLERIDALVTRVREAGLPVDLRVEGAVRRLPAGVDVAAYRIVQEALTNALKYAGGAPTTATIRYADASVDIDVVDEGKLVSPADSVGRGLSGMRQRVGVFGGSITAGPRYDAPGYEVRVHLPCES